MPIQDFLSTALGNRDQGPNHKLADQIVAGEQSLSELIEFFFRCPDNDLQKDAILTLAYVAEINPDLAVPFENVLINNFESKINRVAWGSMIALSHITSKIPFKVYEALPKVIDAMHTSTVVARDYGFRILVSLYTFEEYRDDVLALVLEEIQVAPSNQLGQYTERIMGVIDPNHKDALRKVLEKRQIDLSNHHHLKRLEKNLKKLI